MEEVADAARALTRPASALIILPAAGIDPGQGLSDLMLSARRGLCRTLLLDGKLPAARISRDSHLLHLPPLPSPQELMAGLTGIQASGEDFREQGA